MKILNTDQHQKLQSIILNHLENAKKRNSQYGLRAMAKKADIRPGPMSEIISGKRRLTIEMAKKILDKLLIDPKTTQELLNINNEYIQKSNEDIIQFNHDQYQVLSEWYHLAILNLVETKNFKNDPKIIALRLNIGLETTKNAIERLLKLKMLNLKKGKLVRTTNRYETSEDILNLSIRKFHHNALIKAAEAIDHIEVEHRDISALILPADPKKIKKIKDKIRKFQDRLLKEFDTKDATEVFQISMQVFPLTKEIN
jgi:uncharacterized protein (TIGR02147 family)